MKTHSTRNAARRAAVFTGFLLLAAVPVAVAADTSGLPPAAAGLRAESGSLAARASTATLELYALETELGRARTELARLVAERDALAREQASARAQLTVAKRAVRVSQTQLAELVRALYEQPDQDPLAILLASGSIEEAFAGLDSLSRAAGQNNRIVEQAGLARKRLGELDARLAKRAADLARLTAAADARAGALAATAAERRRFIGSLRARLGANRARIAAIEEQARRAEARTTALAAAAPPPATVLAPDTAPAEIATPLATATGSRTLTVTSSGYALRGRTATGIPTAPGVVAVDPSVIPLGTRMSIPGYGIGIAADTGGAIQGNTIDLWFPTTADALQWGRRTVTITLLQ